MGSGLGFGFGLGLGSGLEPNLGAVAMDLLRVLEQEVEEHQRHDEGREEQVEDARLVRVRVGVRVRVRVRVRVGVRVRVRVRVRVGVRFGSG